MEDVQAVSILLTEAAQGRVAADDLLAVDGGDGNQDGVSGQRALEPEQAIVLGARAVVEVVDRDANLVVDNGIDLGCISLGRRADGVGGRTGGGGHC